MRLIAKDINLRYDEEILVRKYNDTKGLMCDTQFGYKDGLHEPQKLLLLGFMYCSFANEIDHMENLWHLINPNFKQKVSMKTVKSVLEDLLYISID